MMDAPPQARDELQRVSAQVTAVDMLRTREHEVMAIELNRVSRHLVSVFRFGLSHDALVRET
jgi:hypothetical protein